MLSHILEVGFCACHSVYQIMKELMIQDQEENVRNTTGRRREMENNRHHTDENVISYHHCRIYTLYNLLFTCNDLQTSQENSVQ